eukprot:8111727-Pyramimonas_sp.AAC.1
MWMWQVLPERRRPDGAAGRAVLRGGPGGVRQVHFAERVHRRAHSAARERLRARQGGIRAADSVHPQRRVQIPTNIINKY